MRVIGRLLRGLLSLAVLAAVVVGVPGLLAMVGWPLPDHMPSLEELQRALSPGALTPDAVLKGLAVVGWVLWALVVVGSVVEAVAVVRHRQAPSLPGVRPFQGFARWLVTSVTLSFGGLSTAGPALAHPMSPPPALVLALPSGAPPAEVTSPPAPAPAAVAAPTYVVQRNDSLVTIAGAVLGDPDRWQEIFELNYGVPQPTGGSLRSPGVIRTGWVLQLPADARVTSAAEPAEASPVVSLPEADHVVRPGDSMWSIAEERVAAATGRAGGDAPDDEVTPYWSEVVATNAPTVRSGDPNLIFPGEHLRLGGVAGNGQPTVPAPASPPTPAPAGAASPSPAPAGAPEGASTSAPAPPTTAGTPTPTAPPTTATPPSSVVRPGVLPAPAATGAAAPSTTAAPPTTAAQGSGLRPSVSPAPVVAGGDVEEAPPASAPTRAATRDRGSEFPHVKLKGPGLVGAGLLAAGVVGALDRLLRARARRGRAKVVVDPDLAGSELALRVGADAEAAAFLDLGLRAMAGGLRQTDREPPELVAVEVGSRQLEVILAEASTPAPPAFSIKDRGRRWVLPRHADRAELEDLAEDMPAPCPALVTVGRTHDGGWLLVDLEQAAATSIVGDRAVARELLAAATVELATNGWADFLRLVLVGYGMAGQERVRSVGSLADVIEELEQEAGEIGALLGDAECASAFEARVRGEATDAWVPTVVLCAKTPPARMARRLAALATAAGNAGVAVVVAGPLEGAWELVADKDGQLSVGVLDGAVVSAQHLSAEEGKAVEALLQQAGPAFELDGEDLEDYGEEADEAARFYPDYLQAGEDADDGDERAWQPAVSFDVDVDAEGVDDAEGVVTEDVVDTGGLDAEDDWSDDLAPGEHSAPSPVVVASVGPPPGLPPELGQLRLLRDLDMLVGVLGPIEVWGAAKPFTRAKALELVVYLLLHPRSSIDAERLMDALWPGWELKDFPVGRRRPTHSTLNTTTTVARDCLGVGPSGNRRLPHLQGNGTRRYRLEDVALDYQLLRDAVARARAILGDDRSEAKLELREGLTLVRGQPFEQVRDDPRNYQWTHANGAIAAIEREVCEAAHWLAQLCLDDKDPDGARWAARQGLLAVPGHRLLVCDEMTAAGLARNPAGVEGAMRELGELLEADEPFDSLDSHTVAVYKEQMANALRS